jgi:hypothetical protein
MSLANGIAHSSRAMTFSSFCGCGSHLYGWVGFDFIEHCGALLKRDARTRLLYLHTYVNALIPSPSEIGLMDHLRSVHHDTLIPAG